MTSIMNRDFFKGKFIVLDGPDGSGKSTQVGLLSGFLGGNGIETVLCRDPGGTDIGEQVRAILLDNRNTAMSVRCESLLYMASRSQLYDQVIKPALLEGKCVICDRWVCSTYAYQAIGGLAGGEWVLTLAEASLERCWADMTVIIDVPAEVGLKRLSGAPDRMESKSVEFHQQVRQGYINLANRRDEFSVVSGSGSVQEVHKRIREAIARYTHAE